MAQKHRIIFRDNIHGLHNPQLRDLIVQTLGIKSVPNFIYDEIRFNTRDWAIETIRQAVQHANGKKTLTIEDLPPLDREVPLRTMKSGKKAKYFGDLPLRRLILEVSQESIDEHPKIGKGFIDHFRGLMIIHIQDSLEELMKKGPGFYVGRFS